jgi:hypothetical protein
MIKNEKIFTSQCNLGMEQYNSTSGRHYEISYEALYEHRVITFVYYDYCDDLNEHARTING